MSVCRLYAISWHARRFGYNSRLRHTFLYTLNTVEKMSSFDVLRSVTNGGLDLIDILEAEMHTLRSLRENLLSQIRQCENRKRALEQQLISLRRRLARDDETEEDYEQAKNDEEHVLKQIDVENTIQSVLQACLD